MLMNIAIRPIAATTSLSILLHAVAFAGLLLVYEQAVTTGKGLEIQLISSTVVSEQQETDVPQMSEVSQVAQDITAENEADNGQKKAQSQHLSSQHVFTSLNSTTAINQDFASADKAMPVVPQDVKQKQQMTEEGTSAAQVVQSTKASQQQHSILELLHTRISDNKEYPYIARRQRREGVATVGFLLHPDGTIENARLVASSHAGALDRAALSAVRSIEPFKPAQNYLDQAEEFKIDVVFNLL